MAGGLNPDNVQHALKTAASGLDMNSGLESAPGVKDPAKILTAFQRIRAFSFGETQL
jgi:indole-3-glycerol phosphate synthase/phosphoribosylanthranilate isomerase